MRVILLVFLTFLFLHSQQEKLSKSLKNLKTETVNVWIYLKDKGKKVTGYQLNERQKALRGSPVTDFKDLPLHAQYEDRLKPHILKVRHKLKWFNALTATVNIDQLTEIAKLPFVSKIEPVRKLKRKKVDYSVREATELQHHSKTQTSIDYGSSAPQYNLINVPQVHSLGYTGKGVIIGVFDGGFNNLDHEALSPLNIQSTWDFVSNDSDVGDTGYPAGEGNHGTETLSCMAGNKPGKLVGPAFNSSFLLAKTEYGPTETTQEEDNYAAALEWAEQRGAWIVSSSLGYRDFDNSADNYSWQAFDGNTAISTKAADIAASKGILVITSAGNSGDGSRNTLGAPADGDSVLAVGATNSSGNRVSFSSVGPTADGRIKPDVMAQGSSVKVSSPSNDAGYLNVNGTSFSCPITSGSAALLFESNPFATNMEIFNVLRNTANNASSPNKYNGYGVINVLSALNEIKLIDHSTVNSASPNLAIQVSAKIKNTFTGRLNSFQLKYKLSSIQTYTTVNFSQSSQDAQYTYYTATIPAQSANAVLNYYIIAGNGNRSASQPPNFESNPYVITISGGGNNPPTLNSIANITVSENASQQTINLSGISDGDSGTQTIIISANSSNTALIPNPGLAYTQGASTASLTFTPVSNQTGTSTITVTVTDNGSSNNTIQRSFIVTVESQSSGPNNYEPNNNFANAKPLNINQTVKSFIQSNGDEDFFYIDLGKAGALSLRLANFPGDYDLYLYDSNQTQLARAYTTKDPEQIQYNISASGRYYIRVDGYQSAFSSNDDYELTITFTPDNSFDDWIVTNQVIESAHNYSNNTNNTKTYSHSGALKVAVHFSNFDTEKNYDFVYIKDKNNATISTFHGKLNPFWAIVDGDEIKINLVSDYSIRKYGYKIDKVAYFTGQTSTIAQNTVSKNKTQLLSNMDELKSIDIDPLAKKEGKETSSSPVPKGFEVSEPYPNPFNPSTTIAVKLKQKSQLNIEIRNSLGQSVKTLFNGILNAGTRYEFLWNAKNNNELKVSSGIYYFIIKYNAKQIVKRAILIK